MTTINKYSRWIGGVAYLVNAYIHSEMFADNLYIVTVDDLDHVDSIEEIETTAEDLEEVFNDTVKKYQGIYAASEDFDIEWNASRTPEYTAAHPDLYNFYRATYINEHMRDKRIS